MPPLPNSDAPQPIRDVLDSIETQFQLTDERLRDITAHFVKMYQVGLQHGHEPMAMIPTFVTGVPDGTETGTFMAVDLGGTNFRVCEVQLEGNHKFSLKQKKFKVTDELKTGPAVDLFDYMAKCVGDFMKELGNPPAHECLHLGMTFSFPVEQTALGAGRLLTWTKGFSATGAIGNDVVQLLQDSLDKAEVQCKCVALVNDTVGTLLTRGYLTGGCFLGAIFGTGTNGAYVEDMSAVTKLKKIDPSIKNATKMIINTEWGAFDNARHVLPLTRWDNALDRISINPRYQAFEKLISGMYLGEIARNVLIYLIDLPPIPGSNPPRYYLFNGHSTKKFNVQYGFDTELLSRIKSDPSPAAVRGLFVEELGYVPYQVSDLDAQIVAWVCDLVATRSAALSACAVAATLIQCKYVQLGGEPGEREIDSSLELGVDGSLVEFYPGFEDTMRKSLRVIVGERAEKLLNVGMAKDGSGVGAALCALVATKNEAPQST
ncbi:glucokinase [Serendipita sp. 401]|nr:glucokinase [Serendipita sp. 401]KAG9055445.1 glucokinase [Serendipita sp. 407]